MAWYELYKVVIVSYDVYRYLFFFQAPNQFYLMPLIVLFYHSIQVLNFLLQ